MLDCRCGGKGVYVATPEELGYKRDAALDRFAKRPRLQKETVAQYRLVYPQRTSTAFRNESNQIYHFAVDDPGGFGQRCEVHGGLITANEDGDRTWGLRKLSQW